MKWTTFLIAAFILCLSASSFAQKARASEARTGSTDPEVERVMAPRATLAERFETSVQIYDRSASLKDETRLEHRERGLSELMLEAIGATRRANGETAEDVPSEEVQQQQDMLAEFEALHGKYDRASVHKKQAILRDFQASLKSEAPSVKEDNSEVYEEE